MKTGAGSLYRRALGDAFDRLPPALAKFHDAPNGAAALGTLRITRGRGGVRRTLATVMRLPPPGEHVPITLQVQTEGDTEIWTRQFGSATRPVRLVTRQWLDQGLLLETAGPLRFGFRLTADETGMRFAFVRAWFWGMPLPRAIAPRVHAEAYGREIGWRIQVRVEVPLLGTITQYEGTVTPQ